MTEEKTRQRRFISYTSYDSQFVKLMEDLQDKYPEDVFNIQGISSKARDLNEFSKKFFTKSSAATADLTVDSNANINTKTVSQYSAEQNKGSARVNGLYLLWKFIIKNEIDSGLEHDEAIIVSNETIELVVNGALFVNDLASVEKPYCWAQSLQPLVFEGMKFLNGGIHIGKPKRSSSFIQLIIQSIAYMSNQLAGAIALPDFFVYLDWFYRNEMGEDYVSKVGTDEKITKFIHNQFQNFIYSVNFEFRTGQSPFSNISIMDMSFLESLFSETIYPDMTKSNLKSIYELGKRFFEYFESINMKEGIFTFPVITFAVGTEEDKFLDPEFVDWVCEKNLNKAIGNIYTGQPTSLSSCCRLRSTLVKEYQNSFGVGGVSIGSHRVCGINFPRLWKDSNSRKYKINHFHVLLEDRLQSVRKILKAHRRIIQYHIDIGVLPLYTHNWMFLEKQYSTVGIIGIYELQEYYNRFNKNTKTNDYEFTMEVIETVNKFIDEWIKDDSVQYNLEQIPGESMSVRLAEVDRVLKKNSEWEFYSNQYIPLYKNNMKISDRFIVQGNFDKNTSGGSILHINIEENSKLSFEQMKKLFDFALKTGTVYWSLNYIYVHCNQGHFFIGDQETVECPICKSKNLRFYTRIVGFITQIDNWVETRRTKDFPLRKFYQNIS